MRTYALAIALIVAGCSGHGTTTVTPSSTPPSDNGGGGGDAGNGGGAPGGGGVGVDGGMPGGGGSGGSDGGIGGGGGSDGGIGSACTDTQPVAIASAERGAAALAVDDTDVYFVAEPMVTKDNDWNLWRAPASGGTAVEVGTTGNWTAQRMTVNATAVFTLSVDGVLLRWPKSGGAPQTLYDGRTDAATGCLADAHGFIYFCAGDTDVYALVRLPEDGGPPYASVIAGFATYWYLSGIAFDDRDVWMTAGDASRGPTGAVYHMPYDADYHTAPVQAMSVAGTSLGPIAVDDSHVYVADSDRQILVADKRDGATLTPLAQSPGYPSVLRLDGGNLYVLAGIVDSVGNHGTITRYSVDGTRADVLADRAGIIGAMVVRGPYVYYTFENDSTVYRVCK